MQFISALATTFHVTMFDAGFALVTLVVLFLCYQYMPLRVLYEIAFGATVGLGVYILLHVLLLGNETLGTSGGLLPFPIAAFVISVAVYLVFFLAFIFPLHGGLIISETTNPVLYTIQYFFVGIFVVGALTSVLIYMIEQTYLFHVGTVFIWLRNVEYYRQVVFPSHLVQNILQYQHIILPLGVFLMFYKLLLSNIISALILSLVYNLSNVGFYRRKDNSSYRVEFHEVNTDTQQELPQEHSGLK